ncbi:MAG TPA: hypothetical protein DEF57_02555 [Candidatus Magasanikbacteria bacterium]|nr:hypothetical protein [Candidatus Magasanikbacteria bacterium]
MINFLENLTVADYIQISIFVVLFWYSWETHQLRKWQKRQAQLTVLDLDMQRVRHGATSRTNPTPYSEPLPLIIRNIYERGKFDPKILYSRAYHQPLSFTQKVLQKLVNLFKK